MEILEAKVVSKLPKLSALANHRDDENNNTVNHGRMIHLIVLVHGLMGNPLEMDYLKQSLERQALERVTTSNGSCPNAANVVVHSAEANTGKTYDGIAMGGTRLAQEIDWVISHYAKQYPSVPISLSLVGNSLGGLYCRYALTQIKNLSTTCSNDIHDPSSTGCGSNHLDENSNRIIPNYIIPKLFITTCTPHLGSNGPHTFLPIPRWVEYLVAESLQQTGRDLFRFNRLLQDMTKEAKFVTPLSSFERRIAYANVFGTDFQVPTSTAAFWGKTDSLHHQQVWGTEKGNTNIVLQLRTDSKPDASGPNDNTDTDYASSEDLSMALDRLGWTKVLVDVRSWLWSPWRESPSNANNADGITMNRAISSSEHSNLVADGDLPSSLPSWTARQLLEKFDAGRLKTIPLGHIVLVANSKNTATKHITKGGQGTMDYLATSILDHLLEVQE